MILKKPYAFLIKHFRLIHLLLLIPMIYLVLETKGIVTFFSDYIKNEYHVTNVILSNLASNYINLFMYLAIILIICILLTISLVLRKKDKPTKFYNISIVYYLIIFVILTTSFGIFTSIENDTLDNAFARIIRDLSYIIHYSEFIFIAFTFIRGIGFNIKQFNFKSDLEDLEINSEDSEEFEFLVGIDTYKTKRTIRRFFREFIYYYKENKFIFNIVILIVIVSVSSSLYLNREITKTYKEHDMISFDYFNFSIENSYITSKTSSGETLKKDKIYVIIETSINNRYFEDKSFGFENIQLVVNNKFISPNLSLNNYFNDFGNPHLGKYIEAGKKTNYILVYEIDKHLISSDFKIATYSKNATSKGGIGQNSKIINLKPKKLNDNIVVNNINKGTNINLENTNLKKTTASILNYQITNRYEYTYKYCISSNTCYDSVGFVGIDYVNDSNKTLLVLDYKIALDTESKYMYSNKTYKNFFKDFMKIKYTVGNKVYYSAVESVNPNTYNEKFITKISNNIMNSDTIEAIITVRNVSYSIKLK